MYSNTYHEETSSDPKGKGLANKCSHYSQRQQGSGGVDVYQAVSKIRRGN